MKALITLLLILPLYLNAQVSKNEIDWITWDEVEVKMEKEPRKVLVDVYTKWCGPCKIMNKTTFQDKNVVDYINQNYYAIKFDAEGSDEVSFKGTVYKNDG
ncbi:MAG: thioredoxin family protein, partial [Cryomorphaceae bacterium]